MKRIPTPELGRARKMKNTLFWRLRDGMFAMDRRGEAFPSQIGERVWKYAPKGLKEWYPAMLAHLVRELGEVLGYEFEMDDCYTAIEEAGNLPFKFARII